VKTIIFTMKWPSIAANKNAKLLCKQVSKSLVELDSRLIYDVGIVF